MSDRNSYLDQVVANQERLEQDLRSKGPRPTSLAAPMMSAPGAPARGVSAVGAATPASATAGSNAIDVRVTGRLRWRTVVVPPNAFVVHTRRGSAEPLHVGLGISFRYHPATDSYLVVPGAMQTILISAFCICRELQGVLVQAYVQWIIQDFGVAYQKLDFRGDDPMRLVNLQLNEQAQAAIKDKVATMSVGEVLSDKQPIIEELTARLRAVAEGEGGSDTGLGLRIVTVQIKEAVVSSSRLWENLQKPYRAEQGRLARLAELAAEEAISERETAALQERESRRIDTDRQLADLRAQAEAATFDREAAERVRRAEQQEANARALADLTHETGLHALRLERERAAEDTEIARLRLERDQLLRQLTQDGELALAAAAADSVHARALMEIERERLRAGIDNEQTDASLSAKLIYTLPEIAGKMPVPAELRSVTIGGNDTTSLSGLVAELSSVIGALRSTGTTPPA
jgi:regulator of protease activity HflC (stomatin/prohibitin superfamily)